MLITISYQEAQILMSQKKFILQNRRLKKFLIIKHKNKNELFPKKKEKF